MSLQMATFLLAHFQLHDMNKRNRKYAFHEDDKFDLKNDDFEQTEELQEK